MADVGTGTGFMIQGLAPLVKKVYGFDASAEMLKVAARNLEGFDNVELRQADGLSLALEDGSLDAIFANVYLHHVPEPLLALKEMARLLRRGGKVILTDLDRHDQEWMREEMADFGLGFDRTQIDNWLREAGFQEVAIECVPTACCTDSPEGGGSPSLSSWLGARRPHERLRAFCPQCLLYLHCEDAGASNKG